MWPSRLRRRITTAARSVKPQKKKSDIGYVHKYKYKYNLPIKKPREIEHVSLLYSYFKWWMFAVTSLKLPGVRNQILFARNGVKKKSVKYFSYPLKTITRPGQSKLTFIFFTLILLIVYLVTFLWCHFQIISFIHFICKVTNSRYVKVKLIV